MNGITKNETEHAAERADKLLSALDQMQLAFMEAFQHRPDIYLDTHNWNVCKLFWRRRHTSEPIEKNTVVEWRKPDGKTAIIGENRARKHIDCMIEDGFLDQRPMPKISQSKRVLFLSATPKLYKTLSKIFAEGVRAAEKEFAH